MRSYRISANAITTTTANAASVVIVKTGRIRSVRWALDIDSITDNSLLYLELSNQVTSAYQQNDSRGPIAIAKWRANGTAPSGSENKQDLLDCPVLQNERLCLNATASGTLSANADVIIDVEE